MPKGVPKNGINSGWIKKGNTPHNIRQDIYCKYCDKQFHPTGKQVYCSKKCSGKNNQSGTRFKSGFVPWNKGMNSGKTALRDQIENLVEYKNWRKSVYERDDFICQLCKKRGNTLNAHHKKTFKSIIKENNITTVNQALQCKKLWEINNGATLCEKCHKIFTPSVVWVHGQSESGKTTLAKAIQRLSFRTIVLDGDEMRWSISPDLGFSREDRIENNLRIARLTKILMAQGFNIVISTICPYRDLRKEVQRITRCRFIYLEGGKEGKDYPYEQ